MRNFFDSADHYEVHVNNGSGDFSILGEYPSYNDVVHALQEWAKNKGIKIKGESD